jgi:hypothetical protein
MSRQIVHAVAGVKLLCNTSYKENIHWIRMLEVLLASVWKPLKSSSCMHAQPYIVGLCYIHPLETLLTGFISRFTLYTIYTLHTFAINIQLPFVYVCASSASQQHLKHTRHDALSTQCTVTIHTGRYTQCITNVTLRISSWCSRCWTTTVRWLAETSAVRSDLASTVHMCVL